MAEESELLGTYADGRAYRLPQTWKPLDPEVLETALNRTLDALSATMRAPCSRLLSQIPNMKSQQPTCSPSRP